MQIILPKFLTALQNFLRKDDKEIYETILLEIEQIDTYDVREIEASKSPSCAYLDGCLKHISKDLSPIDVLMRSISEKLVWHEASRGVPDFFKGGYAFAEIIGEQGLIVSENIRIGLFLQKPQVNYPLHAHEAEELYIIQPAADTVTFENTSSAKSTIAVVPSTEIAALSRFCPPAE